MFRPLFTRRGAASPAARPQGPATRRPRRSRPCLEDLEGRQLLSLGSPFQLDPGQTNLIKSQAVSASSSGFDNDLSVAAWVQQPVLNNGGVGAGQVVAQLFNNATGAKVGRLLAVSNAPGLNASNPSVSMDRQGDFVVSWTQAQSNGNTSVLAQKYVNDAASGSQVQVGVGTFYQYSSAVAMDPQGGFVVTYVRDTNDNNPDVFAKDYYNNGQLRTTITVAASGKQELNPSIAMDDSGNFDIAYQLVNGGSDAIYLARYNDFDTLLGVGEVTTGSASNTQPNIAMDDSDDVVVAYLQPVSGIYDGVYATMISQGEWAKPKVFIGDVGTAYFTPSVALPALGGEFAVSYTQYTPGGAEAPTVAVVGPGNTVTQTYAVGTNDGSVSLSTLPAESGQFVLTYISTNHVYGRIGTYD
jgi:hypothetical protein